MNNENFTEGKILSPLIKFTIPVFFAIFLQTMYGAVDMLIVEMCIRDRSLYSHFMIFFY